MTLKDALQLLDLSTPFTRAGLKKACAQALKVWHPDRFPAGDELQVKAHAKTRLIIEAYEELQRALGRNDSCSGANGGNGTTHDMSATPEGNRSSGSPRHKPDSARRAGRTVDSWRDGGSANRGLFERWIDAKTSKDVAELWRAARRKRKSGRIDAAEGKEKTGSRINQLTAVAVVVFIILALMAILGVSLKKGKELNPSQMSSP